MEKLPSVMPFPNKKWGYLYRNLPDYSDSKHKEIQIFKFDMIWHQVARRSPHILYVRLAGQDKQYAVVLTQVLTDVNTLHPDIESLCKKLNLFQGRQQITREALNKRLGRE